MLECVRHIFIITIERMIKLASITIVVIEHIHNWKLNGHKNKCLWISLTISPLITEFSNILFKIPLDVECMQLAK